MIKNIIVSALVALVVGSISGGFVAARISTPVGSDALGAAPLRGDTVTNYQNFANDLLISGAGNQALGTTTLRILSNKSTRGVCIEANATSSAQKVNVQFYSTTTGPLLGTGLDGFLGFKLGACK